MSRPFLSIVIPAYKEAERLGPTLDRVLAWADAFQTPSGAAGRGVEVLVVDDGSPDATADVARRYADRSPTTPVRLVQNGRNRGKGYSVRNGVLAARGEQILFSDADLSTPIEDYAVLAEALRGAPIAIGSRALADSNVAVHQPKYREAMGRVFNSIVQGLAVPGVRDTQCGFKLFRADVGQALFRAATIEGFAFDVEVLHLAQRRGLAIAEVPVTWRNDERSRVSPIRDSLRMFRDVVTIRLRHAGSRPASGESS